MMRGRSANGMSTTVRSFLTLGATVAVVMAASVVRPAGAQQRATELDALARASDVVVEGVVERTRTFPNGPDGLLGIHTRVELRVIRTLRGLHASHVVVWVHGGQIGDRRRVVVGQATFRSGEHVVVFAHETGHGLFPTGMGRGRWVIGPDGVATSGRNVLDLRRLASLLAQMAAAQ